MELLERPAFLSELGGLLEEAAAGRGRLVLVGGEAGVGSALAVAAENSAVAAKRRFRTQRKLLVHSALR